MQSQFLQKSVDLFVKEEEEEKEEDSVVTTTKTTTTTVPFSKKARILDLHYNQQKKQKSDSLKISSTAPSCEQSQQAYCLKCDIQFKQMNNYLAHKRLYCN